MSVTEPSGRGACALVVAKAPAPGRTKTRLSGVLSPETAAALARAMLLDTLETCRTEIDDVRILHARPEEAAPLAVLAGPGVPLVLQQGEGLSAALLSGARVALETRDAVVLVASDIPGVPPGSLAAAVERLSEGADVVLGPGLDGGYWLVGLSHPHPEPFEGIPWSTPDVLDTTLGRCTQAGLTVALIDAWRDVDTAEDIAALLPDLDRLPGRRTAELLRAHGRGTRITPPIQPHAQEVPLR
jgi:rSAM/selenodomain-associated transferase 1